MVSQGRSVKLQVYLELREGEMTCALSMWDVEVGSVVSCGSCDAVRRCVSAMHQAHAQVTTCRSSPGHIPRRAVYQIKLVSDVI